MRRIIFWVPLAMVVVAGPPAIARAPVNVAPFEIVSLAPGIHLLSMPEGFAGPAISNVTVIEQSDGVVLIDSGISRGDGDRIVSFVGSLTKKPVKAVLITHWHNDHHQGVSQIRSAWPKVRIIATDETRRGILGPAASQLSFAPDPKSEAKVVADIADFVSQLEAVAAKPETDEATRARYRIAIEQNRAMILEFAGTYLVEPNEILTGPLTFKDRRNPVTFQFMGRANTSGDAVAWLPRQKMVVTGDIVVAPIPFGFFSYPSDWIDTIGKIKALGFKQLVPGHGRPQKDTSYLDQLVTTITDIRTQVGSLAQQGLSLEEVRKRVNFDGQSAIFGSTPRLKRTFDAYWITPMVENAYKEAKGEPIIQGGGDGPS